MDLTTDIRALVEAAERRIRQHIRATPVEESAALGGDSGAVVHLKLENLQITGSFKLRGAMNKLLSLTPGERQRGIVTASSGNHGAAIAYGLRALGCRGLIFVPEGASPAKMAAIRALGAEVREQENDSGKTEVFARRYALERGLVYVSPYNDAAVVAGQGTIGLELAGQLGTIDALFVALGGGGLISGVAGYLKAIGRQVEVVACSPENSAVMHHSLSTGRIVEMESKPTLSDGTAGAVEQSAITLETCRRWIDRSVLVSEAEIALAMRLIIDRHHTLIEGAAGVAVAGYMKERERLAGRRVAVILCGANIARDRLKEIL